MRRSSWCLVVPVPCTVTWEHGRPVQFFLLLCEFDIINIKNVQRKTQEAIENLS